MRKRDEKHVIKICQYVISQGNGLNICPVDNLRAPRMRSSSFFSTGNMLLANLSVRLIVSNASEYLRRLANALHNYNFIKKDVKEMMDIEKYVHINVTPELSKIFKVNKKLHVYNEPRLEEENSTNVDNKAMMFLIFKKIGQRSFSMYS